MFLLYFFSEACNYLFVYEYVISSDLQQDTWGGMKRAIATKGIDSKHTAGSGKNRTLLLGGRKDGHICVFDWETGQVSFEIEVERNSLFFYPENFLKIMKLF